MMTEELIETLRIIIDRYQGRTQGSVFIPMTDFPWYNERNGQLSKLQQAGIITEPRYSDNGAEITLTSKGRHFFDPRKGMIQLSKEKLFEILSALSNEMHIPAGDFGFKPDQCRVAIKQLQEQGFIRGARFSEGGWDPNPRMVWLDTAYITEKGLQFIDDYKKSEVDIIHEFVSACTKISDNPISYAHLDEDGLNREVRNLMDSAISRFGYTIADQTQQGLSGTKPGELDIWISKNGIPVGIYEGLIHSSRQYLYDHIDKAIDRYNMSGCSSVYVVEFSRNKGFGGYWDSAKEAIDEYSGIKVTEVNTLLLGVKLLSGSFEWEGQQGNFNFIGVNCYVKSPPSS